MKKIAIDFQNCFGIGSLQHTFDFERSNSCLIYAPNGTMKTSFAKTMDLIAKNDLNNMPMDKIYPEREPVYKVSEKRDYIAPDRILVINAENNTVNGSESISTFLAKEELKERYDAIYNFLDREKKNFITALKRISGSSDCEAELESVFLTEDVTNFFEILLSLQKDLNDNYFKPDFKYNDVFDTGGKVKNFLEKNKDHLEDYIFKYNKLLSESFLFKGSSESSFGTYQANAILKSIDDNAFFNAGHKLVLQNQQEISDKEELKALINSEIQRISDDESLKKVFDRIDKAITANVDLRLFHKVIERNSNLLLHLADYEGFKAIVWKGFLSEMKESVDHLISIYQENQKDLTEIIAEAQKDIQLWTDIIDTFNRRFKVPFVVKLSNQEDVILKKQTASLEFHYQDSKGELVSQDKDHLLSVLSRGERRAFFILQFLFQLESRKLLEKTQLLVLDDIADSFDYKNKFAIIEYIKELHEEGIFKIIMLTHNFDFYRTIASRLSLPHDSVYMATSYDERKIKLHKGQYRNDVFSCFLQQVKQKKIFISLIAFIRNIIEYTEGSNSDDYITLTSCLHVKEVSDALTVKEIFDIYKKRFPILNGKQLNFNNEEKILNLIHETAKSICAENSPNEIYLENKIVLAIAIRLTAEEYMLRKLSEDFDPETIESNQTQELYKAYKMKFMNSPSLSILDRVNLMTPENIHINAFMYEPLIDMSVHHLILLYKELDML